MPFFCPFFATFCLIQAFAGHDAWLIWGGVMVTPNRFPRQVQLTLPDLRGAGRA